MFELKYGNALIPFFWGEGEGGGYDLGPGLIPFAQWLDWELKILNSKIT